MIEDSNIAPGPGCWTSPTRSSCPAKPGTPNPDPRIYHAALRQLAASPGSALFIDDTPGHVAAAQALGLAGHLHTSTATTITRIEDFLAA
jgi:putative hydrolase of the HAD superfamily